MAPLPARRYLDQKTCDLHYNGFCNSVLWQLFHYVPLNIGAPLGWATVAGPAQRLRLPLGCAGLRWACHKRRQQRRRGCGPGPLTCTHPASRNHLDRCPPTPIRPPLCPRAPQTPS